MNLDEMLKSKPARHNQCKWHAWYTNLTEQEQTSIQTAFNDDNTETSHIVRVLHEYGCPLSDSTIRTHRRGECKTCNG